MQAGGQAGLQAVPNGSVGHQYSTLIRPPMGSNGSGNSATELTTLNGHGAAQGMVPGSSSTLMVPYNHKRGASGSHQFGPAGHGGPVAPGTSATLLRSSNFAPGGHDVLPVSSMMMANSRSEH